jgi:hypothetical protein
MKIIKKILYLGTLVMLVMFFGSDFSLCEWINNENNENNDNNENNKTFLLKKMCLFA